MEPSVLASQLAGELDAADAALQRFDDYRAGRHRLAFATEKFRTTFGRSFGVLASNFCALVVDAVEERLTASGFRVGGSSEADAGAWDLWRANGLDLAASQVHREALTVGRSFVSVWAGPDGAPSVRPESARQVRVAYAPGTRRRTAALKRWEEGGYVHAVLYLPDEVHRLRSATPAAGGVPVTSWVARGEVLSNPLGVVPMVPLVGRPLLLDADGESELVNVIPLQDAINKTLVDMLVTSEHGAMRRRWATGLEVPTDPETGAPLEPFDVAAGRLWVAEDPAVKFGSFDESSLSNYTGAVETLLSHLAAVSALPVHYFGLSGEYPSGDALRSSEAGLVAKCRRRQAAFGAGWAEVIGLALAVRDGTAPPAVETLWASCETRTQAQEADAAVKRAEVGVPQEQLWLDLGYSPADVERFRDMARRQSADRTAMDLDLLLRGAGAGSAA